MVTTITATLVQKLRARTGAGMMDCKNALVASAGDLDAAAEAMRKSGQIEAEKKSDRSTTEGLILVKSNAQFSIILEINCETDFVSRDDNFKQFAETITQLALDNKIETVEALLQTCLLESGQSVENVRQDLITKIGENIKIRRLMLIDAQPNTVLGAYVHNGRIGAIVQIEGSDEQLAKDLALHVIANEPLVISAADVSSEAVKKEREIFSAQAQASGKPQAIIDKMVEERIAKFLSEVSLLGQTFIKDETITIKELLDNSRSKVIRFIRFVVGEGMERTTEDFAEAVMAQIKT